jgi:hypothetical protein
LRIEFYECLSELDIVAVLMDGLKCAQSKSLTQGAQGFTGWIWRGLAVDFSMGGIEILQSGDGARSGSMGLDH